MASILDPWGYHPITIDQYANLCLHILPQDRFLTFPLSCRSSNSNPLWLRPLSNPLLFPNETSDTRDHCANERTFLSWLRLSIYMSVVSAAIILSFHLKSDPTAIERQIARPVGLLFWFLSLTCLISGLANYLRTVRKYAQRSALVQTGWKTQVVS